MVRKGVQDQKQCMFILQSLGKDCLCYWESFSLSAANSNDKEYQDHVWEAFEGSFRQTSSFRNYREETIFTSREMIQYVIYIQE